MFHLLLSKSLDDMLGTRVDFPLSYLGGNQDGEREEVQSSSAAEAIDIFGSKRQIYIVPKEMLKKKTLPLLGVFLSLPPLGLFFSVSAAFSNHVKFLTF